MALEAAEKAVIKMTKISEELARKEITEWLDKKKVYPSIREEQGPNIDMLVEAMTMGDLILDTTTGEFTHNLLFPMPETNKLTYKSRLNDRELRPYQNSGKNDFTSILLGYVSALTKQPKAIIENLDTADRKISQAIAVFFI
jgi:hypothetical protein